MLSSTAFVCLEVIFAFYFLCLSLFLSSSSSFWTRNAIHHGSNLGCHVFFIELIYIFGVSFLFSPVNRWIFNFIDMLHIDGNFLLNARGVGFLRYFQLKQLPNFLLATPILSLAVSSIVYYAKSEPEKFFSLGFRSSAVDKSSAAVFFSLGANLRSSDGHVKEKSSPNIEGIIFKFLFV